MLQTSPCLAGEIALMRALHMMAGESSALVDQATAALDILLGKLHASPRPDAWAFSTLTQNGFPVELAMTAQEPGLRYTTEVAGPEVAMTDRLPHAERLLACLGAGSLPDERLAELRQLQASGPLKWGAWIGARHCPDGDRYKLYVEMPRADSAAVTALIGRYLGVTSLLPDEATPLIAIGLMPDSSRIELYFEFEPLELKYWQISYLMHEVGLRSRSQDLLGLMEQVRGYRLGQARPQLPPAIFGFSYALSTPGEPPVFSLFGRVGMLLGGDGQIRRQLLRLADQMGWDFSRYAELTQPLSHWTWRNEHHNAIGFIVGPQGPPLLHLSLSPPEMPMDTL